MKYRLLPFLTAATLVLQSGALAEIQTVASSSQPGPTVLLVSEPKANDLSIDVAVEQAKNWNLTKGKVLLAPIAEAEAAIKAQSPSEVLVLRTIRSKDASATLTVSGFDGKALIDSLNQQKDEKGETILLGDDLKVLPTTRPSNEPAATPVKIARLSLAIKVGGTVPAARTRLFRQAIYETLIAEKMTDSSPWTVIKKSPDTISVALYAGYGSESSPGPTAFPKAFKLDPRIRYTYIGATELKQPNFLEQFDAICFCGGISSTQSKAIGKDGAEAVRSFVKNGGGYISTCAGSYLASSGFDWSLHLINAKVNDYTHWLRGTGDVDVELTDEGRKIFGDYKGLVKIHYANGPLLAPGTDADLTAFTPLGYFRSDMAKSAPGGQMPNREAIITAGFGKGKILCFSPHPEFTPGLEGFIGRALCYVTNNPIETKTK